MLHDATLSNTTAGILRSRRATWTSPGAKHGESTGLQNSHLGAILISAVEPRARHRERTVRLDLGIIIESP